MDDRAGANTPSAPVSAPVGANTPSAPVGATR